MFWRKQRERDLERELRDHLELEAEQQADSGLTGEQARNAARRAFGNTTLVKEEVREMWGWTFASQLRQDLRYALRTIRGNRTFSAAAVVSLALGIGANTAIFTLIDAVLLRTLPVRDPGGLVQLMMVEQGRQGNSFGYPSTLALAERTEIFDGVCGFTSAVFNVDSPDGSQRVPGAWVTGGFYSTLGLEPFAGRLLTADDDRPGAPPVAVLSYAYWESRFGRDFGVVGRSISIEGKPVTIVGISPNGFTGANIGDAGNLTLALGALPQLLPERAASLESGAQWLRVLARPRAGISVAQAQSRLAVVWPRMASIATTPRMNPKRREVILHSSIDLVPGATGFSYLRGSFRRPLLVLMAVTGIVLLIACANFANLLLARGAARSKEIALRFAIGAGRGRIVRQLLTESLILSSLGAALGIGVAGLGSRLLITLLSTARRDAVQLDVQPDLRVLLFTSAVGLATGILFGLVPALRATAVGPGAALKGGSGIAPRTRSRLLPTLVASQVALSLMLLIGAALFVRTLENLERLDPGFRSQGVLLVNLDPRRAGYKDARLAAVYEELLGRFQHLPAVVSASLSSNTPLSGGVWSEPVSVNGQPPTRESAHLNLIAPGYFATLGTPLVLGRDFSAGDRAGAAGVAIVNETFARRFLEGRPLGHRISIPNPHYGSFEVVGIVKDMVLQSLREPAPPSVFLPAFQYPEMVGAAYFELRAEGSLMRTAALVRDELRAKFPAMPAEVLVEPLTEQVRRTLIQERMLATLGTCFGALALVLAAVGLYGLLAYAVARSTSEIAIRLALGAKRGEVLAWVLRRALRLLAWGVALGIPAAWAASRLISSTLFGLTPTDPLAIGGATALLALSALAAALLPALRAARIDPIVALRCE
jgi:putative ABC transport system permease protein